MEDCRSTGNIQEKLKRLFAGTIEQMLEAEMDEHLGYEKNSVAGNNTGNSRKQDVCAVALRCGTDAAQQRATGEIGYGKKTISSDYGDCGISIPRDRNGEFEPKVIEKRQTSTDEIDQKIRAMYAKKMSQRDIEDIIRDICGSEISQGLFSRITNKILSEVNE